MENKCYKCGCVHNGLHTVPHCSDSYPDCMQQSPCSEMISDMCVLHTPNDFLINFGNGNFLTVTKNMPLYNVLQLLLMAHDITLQQYAFSTNIYGPILGLRSVWESKESFKLYWDYPYYIPPAQQMTTKFVVYIREKNNLPNTYSFILDTTKNEMVAYSHNTLLITSNKEYIVRVYMINAVTNAVLTSSIDIIVKTK